MSLRILILPECQNCGKSRSPALYPPDANMLCYDTKENCPTTLTIKVYIFAMIHEQLEANLKAARKRAIDKREIPGVVALIRAGNRHAAEQAAEHLRRGLEWLVYETAIDDDDPGEMLALYYTTLDAAIESLAKNQVRDLVHKLRADFKRAAVEQSEWQQRNRIWQKGRGNKRYPRKCLKRSRADHALHRSDRSDCRSTYETVASREAAERYATRWCGTWDAALDYCESRRESEIVGYAADGCDPGEIAKMIHTSRRYVESILDSVVGRLYRQTNQIVCYGGDDFGGDDSRIPATPGAYGCYRGPQADRPRPPRGALAG